MGLILLGLCSVAALRVAAYEYPLSEESVREAYILGRSTDTEKLSKFLRQYVHQFPYPVNGPYVGEIDFRTPYDLAVLRSWTSTNYSAQKAQEDYAAQPNLDVVRVLIYTTPTYPDFKTRPSASKDRATENAEGFWRALPIRVAQAQTIEPKKLSGMPLYKRRGGGLGGAEVLLEFDAAQVDSGTVRIEITTPDGKWFGRNLISTNSSSDGFLMIYAVRVAGSRRDIR